MYMTTRRCAPVPHQVRGHTGFGTMQSTRAAPAVRPQGRRPTLHTRPTANPAFGLFARPTFIYAISITTDRRLVKVGKAADPAARLSTLSTSLPYGPELLAVWRNDYSMEPAMHHLLAQHRIRGEWFDLGPDPVPRLQEVADSPELGAFMERHARRRIARAGRLLDLAEHQVTPREYTWLAVYVVDGDGPRSAIRRTPAELAQEAGYEPHVVRDVLAGLARKGWLKRVGGSNATSAHYCLGPKFGV